MLDNTISLDVDVENDGIDLDTQTFTRFEEYLNRSVYIGENHTLSAKDTLAFYRTAPKPTSVFKGVAKSAVKFSKEIGVLGVDGVSTITSPIIVEVGFSIPVGASTAQVLEMRQRVVALLDTDAVMNALNLQLMV